MIARLPRFLRRWVRRLRDLPLRFGEYPEQKQTLGAKAAKQLGWSVFRYPIGDHRDGAGPVSSVLLPGLVHPFYFRQGTSDVLAIKQLFVLLEYRRLQALKQVETIVDAGANIGAAAVVLLTMFPQAKLIAMEPDPGNAAILRRNLEPYGERVTIGEAAVWPTPEPLQLVHAQFRDKLDWSIQVKPGVSTSSVQGVTIQQLLENSRWHGIDLLKIDIEGAEVELFRGDTAWLKRVKNLCIEIHSEEAKRLVDQSLAPFHYQQIIEGETTYYLQMTAKDATPPLPPSLPASSPPTVPS